MLATFKRSNERGNNSEHKKTASVMRRLSIDIRLRYLVAGAGFTQDPTIGRWV